MLGRNAMFAAAPQRTTAPGRMIYLEILVLVLSIFSILALAAELMLPLGADERALLNRLDWAVCAVFLLDFVVHLWRAPDRLGYLRWGWIDLISSIPVIEWLRWGRIFRVVRILRALRSFHEVAEHFALAPAKGTFGIVSILTVLVAIFSALAMLNVERGVPGANIHSADDALWWAFVTLTTIGYGDHYPVTGAGRMIAVILVICGLSIFGTFTALVASFFVGRFQKRTDVELSDVLHEVRELRREVTELRRNQGVEGEEEPRA
ncbi:MAG: ion transporter [Opitutus sp.]|nr:ion transporter [Opitutus sp.]